MEPLKSAKEGLEASLLERASPGPPASLEPLNPRRGPPSARAPAPGAAGQENRGAGPEGALGRGWPRTLGALAGTSGPGRPGVRGPGPAASSRLGVLARVLGAPAQHAGQDPRRRGVRQRARRPSCRPLRLKGARADPPPQKRTTLSEKDDSALRKGPGRASPEEQSSSPSPNLPRFVFSSGAEPRRAPANRTIYSFARGDQFISKRPGRTPYKKKVVHCF